jgi:hypothetical protein
VVTPRSTFLKDLISPIHHASSKAAIKTGPPPQLASKQELHFETVESHVSFPSATILGKLLLGYMYHASGFFLGRLYCFLAMKLKIVVMSFCAANGWACVDG